MKTTATIKDAIDLLIVHKGFEAQLPEDFLPYWERLCSVIDTLGADTTKTTKKGNPIRKERNIMTTSSMLHHSQKKSQRKITLPNGLEIEIDVSVPKEVANFIANIPILSEKKSPSKQNTPLSRCLQKQCKEIYDTIMGHNFAALDEENIQCNFMEEKLAHKLE